MKEMMNELTSLKQLDEIKKSSAVSVLVFSANWCPDVVLRTVHAGIDKRYSDYQFYYINLDEWMQVCVEFNVMGIPSFVALRNGEEIGSFCIKK